jgi:hypothetical protein
LHSKLDPGRNGVLPARRGVHMDLNKQERQCKERLTLYSIADGCSGSNLSSGVDAVCPTGWGIHEDLNKAGRECTEERKERTLIIFAVANAKKRCPRTVELVVSFHVRMESFQPDGGMHVDLNKGYSSLRKPHPFTSYPTNPSIQSVTIRPIHMSSRTSHNSIPAVLVQGMGTKFTQRAVLTKERCRTY